MSWSYDSNDPGVQLFTTALAAGAPMPLGAGDTVLEVGCSESDWLSRANMTWPEAHFVGVDWRATTHERDGCLILQGDALKPDLFHDNAFDAIVSLSAIEHFGLGHYSHDPLDPDGDTQIIANCWRWLKPGGWLYFDVPYDPRGYRVCGTEYRTYDDDAFWDRLWAAPLAAAKMKARWRWGGFVRTKEEDTLIPKPDTQDDDRLHYYIAACWHKVGSTSPDCDQG